MGHRRSLGIINPPKSRTSKFFFHKHLPSVTCGLHFWGFLLTFAQLTSWAPRFLEYCPWSHISFPHKMTSAITDNTQASLQMIYEQFGCTVLHRPRVFNALGFLCVLFSGSVTSTITLSFCSASFIYCHVDQISYCDYNIQCTHQVPTFCSQY